jgi:GntR family transcriptional regulator/MocR family aminotransferase
MPVDAGLHMAARAAPDIDVGAWMRKSMAQGIRVENLAAYGLGDHGWHGTSLGFGLIEARRIDEAIRRAVTLLP